jgi:hypothetical protein
MLSLTEPAVSVAEADAYASARAWSNWAGADAAKEAAIRRGQDFIAGEYNGLWLEEWENDDAPEAVRFAIIEAARRELATPGILSPDVNLGSAKVLTGVGSIRWTPLKGNASVEDMMTTFTAIRRLLSGLVEKPSATSVTSLARA